MDSGSASQGVQGCPGPGMAERGEGRGTGLPPVQRTSSQQGSGSGMNKQMCHRTYRDLRARQTWMQVVS